MKKIVLKTLFCIALLTVTLSGDELSFSENVERFSSCKTNLVVDRGYMLTYARGNLKLVSSYSYNGDSYITNFLLIELDGKPVIRISKEHASRTTYSIATDSDVAILEDDYDSDGYPDVINVDMTLENFPSHVIHFHYKRDELGVLRPSSADLFKKSNLKKDSFKVDPNDMYIDYNQHLGDVTGRKN